MQPQIFGDFFLKISQAIHRGISEKIFKKTEIIRANLNTCGWEKKAGGDSKEILGEFFEAFHEIF